MSEASLERIPWTEKHRPRSLDEIVGQKKAVEAIRKWIEDVRAGKKVKPLLLYGPPGTGKTSAAYAIARELDMEIVEVNASDVRNREHLSKLLEGLTARSLFTGKRRMILFDEIDALPSEARAIASILREILKRAPVPIVLTANDPYEQGLAELRGLTTMVQFTRLRWTTVYAVLRRIAQREGVHLPETALKAIAQNSKGDLRAAINDLEAVAKGSRELVGAVGRLFGSRDIEKNIFELMRAIFLGKNCRYAAWMTMNVDVDPDMILRWVEENAPLVYKSPRTLALAYEYLSRADIFRGRIVRTQSWRLLAYANEMATLGVCSAKLTTGEQTGYVRFSFPSWVKKASATVQSRRTIREVSLQLAKRYHVSSKVVAREILPLIKAALGDRPAKVIEFARRHGLDPEALQSALENVRGVS